MVQTVEEAQVLFSASGMGKVETAAGRANRTMSRMTSIAGRATSAIRGIGRAATSFRGIASIAALGYSIKQASDAASEQIAAERKLESVLAATGNAAGFTADELKQMAADLQQVTNYGDEATISAMGVMASFTNIRGDVFQGAVVAAQDLSAVMGQDLQSSVVQIGKALNDPIKGVTALQRVGVAFTQQQRDQINALVESGNSMAAQQMILAELKKEFGGAAEAMADPFTQFGNAAGDVQEELGMLFREIGMELLPIGHQLLEWTSDTAKGLRGIGEELASFVQAGVDTFVDLQDHAADFGTFLGVVSQNIGDLFSGMFSDMVNSAKAAFDFITNNISILFGNLIAADKQIASKLSFGLVGDADAQFRELESFEVPESAVAAAVSNIVDESRIQMWEQQGRRAAQRAQAPDAAVAAKSFQGMDFGGVSLVPRQEIEPSDTAQDGTEEPMQQAAEALQQIATQRGSALQVMQRVQESLQKRAAELAEKQLAEQREQTAIAEKQLTIMEQQRDPFTRLA